MDLKCKMIMEEYKSQRPDFVSLGETVHSIIAAKLKEANISPLAIEHRVKQEQSLAGKLELKGDKYGSLADITDILGARIICFFNDEVDRIAKIIEELFSIDWENSVDKRAIIKPDSFGYLSLHYICYLPADSEYPSNICEKKFEIQIRTTLQHTWAVINHDLGYKSNFGVPRRVQREFSRVASLLEVADDHFVRIRDDILDYEDEVRTKIANDTADDLKIDNVSLNEYVLSNKLMKQFMAELSVLCDGAEISYISAEPYILQLSFLGIKTLGQLSDFLIKNKSVAILLAKKMLENTDLDILSSNVGLRFLCRAELINKEYTFEKIVDFMKLTFADEVRAERQAKRVSALAKQIKEDEQIRYNKALEFATKMHEGQLRLGGEPYVTHVIAVAQMVKEQGYGIDFQITALFHDLLEDTQATEDEILAISDENTLRTVKILTKYPGYDMAEYISGIKSDTMAFVVKCADRLHNLKSAFETDEDFKKRYIKETKEWYLDFSDEIKATVAELEKSLA